MPIAVTEEQLALQAAIRDWAKRAGTLASVRGLEPPGPDAPADGVAGADSRRQWAELAALGVLAIGLPESAGGAGGTVADAGAALEELASALAPGPVLPTVLAGLALAPHADGAVARELLTALADGTTTATVILPGSTLTGQWQPDGSLLVHGATGPVLAGAHLIVAATTAAPTTAAPTTAAPTAWFRVGDDHPGITVTSRAPVDFSRPLASFRFDGVVIPAGQLLPDLDTERVRALAAALFSVEAAAVAAWCTRTAAAYAQTRRQFGRPIGSFQAVKHLCAGQLVRAERAAALAWDAVRAADEAPAEFPLAAAAAAALALDDAVDCAKDCVQVLGGIGFTWEHDAHLYLRRALAARQLLGGGAAWRERTAMLALSGVRRHLATPAPESPGTEPEQELRPNQLVGIWARDAVVRYGTAAQRERFVGATSRGEITWCQLFSEPEAGSDLASLRTRAVQAAGGWRLTGQKVWTSLAHEADWAICLARTDPDVPKHRGLAFFMVDMRADGIDIRPLREITGRAMFNEVFLDDVFVPGENVLGEPGDGWRIARSTLAAERVAMGKGSSFGAEVENLLAWAGVARVPPHAAGPVPAPTPTPTATPTPTLDPRVLERVGGLVADGLAGSLLDVRAALAQEKGTDAGHLAAIRKLLGVAHRQAVAETALELSGPEGAAADGAAADAVQKFLLTRCLSIAGGTTQILLSVVAERVLGLPREEAR